MWLVHVKKIIFFYFFIFLCGGTFNILLDWFIGISYNPACRKFISKYKNGDKYFFVEIYYDIRNVWIVSI